MNKKTKLFLAILIIIILILTLITFLFPTPEVLPSPSISPTPIPQGDANILEQQEETRINQYPLLDKTPYKTSLFEISYVGPLRLKVAMFSKDEEKIKEEVNRWIEGNGVDPRSHQIEFVPPKLPY